MSKIKNNTPNNSQYTAESIEVLSGLDPVKKRPGMYTNTSDPLHLGKEVFDNSVDEALAGHASKIEVVLYKDGSLSVSDDGRGMPVDKHAQEKISTCSLHAAPIGHKRGASGAPDLGIALFHHPSRKRPVGRLVVPVERTRLRQENRARARGGDDRAGPWLASRGTRHSRPNRVARLAAQACRLVSPFFRFVWRLACSDTPRRP